MPKLLSTEHASLRALLYDASSLVRVQVGTPCAISKSVAVPAALNHSSSLKKVATHVLGRAKRRSVADMLHGGVEELEALILLSIKRRDTGVRL
jgi:hypothetical protein